MSWLDPKSALRSENTRSAAAELGENENAIRDASDQAPIFPFLIGRGFYQDCLPVGTPVGDEIYYDFVQISTKFVRFYRCALGVKKAPPFFF